MIDFVPKMMKNKNDVSTWKRLVGENFARCQICTVPCVLKLEEKWRTRHEGHREEVVVGDGQDRELY